MTDSTPATAAGELLPMARVPGECPSDPCPTCTALVEIYEAVYPSAD